MNSRFRNALVFALLLPFATMAVADARPGGASFRGGFSSQKSSAARAVPSRQPSFGSFGARRPDAAPARPAPPPADAARDGSSAMSRDLDRQAAQDRAMRSWDSRRDATAASGTTDAARAPSGAMPPLPPLNPVLPGGVGTAGRSAGATPGAFGASGSAGAGAGAGGYGQPGPAPVVIRERSSNAWLWGLGGYLLGSHAMSHAKDAPPAPSQPAPSSTPASTTDATPTGAATNSAAGGTGSASDAAQVQAQAAEPLRSTSVEARQERSTIRTLTWLALVIGFVWLLYIGWRQVNRGKKHANYSFERN
jgi:hypothetical protein